MGYSRFSTRFRKRGFKKVAVVAKPKSKYVYKKRVPRVSFAKRVNAIVAKNVETKFTQTYNLTNYLCKYLVAYSSPDWFIQQDFHGTMFAIEQGVQQENRIGNKIKLKNFWIKGQIHPAVTGDFRTDDHLANSQMGYVTLYLAIKKNGEAITTKLHNLLQQGATSYTPMGAMNQLMMKDNTDKYRIYWKRTFKVGAGFHGSYGNDNNDFKLCQRFSINVCSKILKNAIISYNDENTIYAQNNILQHLALFATWTPYVGNVTAGFDFPNSLYAISTTSWAEYEDA